MLQLLLEQCCVVFYDRVTPPSLDDALGDGVLEGGVATHDHHRPEHLLFDHVALCRHVLKQRRIMHGAVALPARQQRGACCVCHGRASTCARRLAAQAYVYSGPKGRSHRRFCL